METRPIPVQAPENVMSLIDEAFTGKSYNSEEFAAAAMSLFKEYRNAYQNEWIRMDNCERLYLGDTWPLIKANAAVNGKSAEADGCYGSKQPEPSVPIIHSTIENLEADLYQDLPDCYVKPQDGLKEADARIINMVLHRQLEDCDFNEHYFEATHELLVYGWTVFEVGYELKGVADAHNFRTGGVFIRHVPSRSIMFDPTTSRVQDNRVVFKFERHPRHWFKKHYPDKFDKMSIDPENLNDRAQSADDPQNNIMNSDDSMIFVEMWYREFDAKENRYRVHMAQFAGGVEVANSATVKREGMYEHGLYPFELDVLYPRVGTPFGNGIADIHAGLQMYSDKLNQIIMTSALRSSRGRVFISSANEEAYDDIVDFSKEAIKVNDITGVQWFQDKPLPQYIMNYLTYLQQAIKEESGTNDQSRGIPGGGVTAGSAISALQTMATKRSSKVAERRQQMFKRLAAMAIDTLADCALIPYLAVLTVDGNSTELTIDSKLFKAMQEDGRTPTRQIFIRVARQTRYAKQQNNDLALQFMQMASGQNSDFTPFIEMMDFEDKELVLQKIRASQQTMMAQLMQQNQQLMQQLEQMQQELSSYKQTMQRAQAAMATRGAQQEQALATAPLEIPKGMAQNAV
jgi:hypothetical protein